MRRFYPTLPIVIADDSRQPTIDPGPHLDVVRLPYDTGLAAGRNAALARVSTPYVVVCDDDFVFCRQTRLDRLLAVAEATPFAIVGGMLMDHRRDTGVCRGLLRYAGTLDIEDRVYRHRKGATRGLIDGRPRYDLVINFFLARRADIGPDPWDARFKIGPEHGDFFLTMKQRGVWTTLVEDVWVEHHPRRPLGYGAMRNRTEEFIALFKDKWGIDDVVIDGPAEYTFADKLRYGMPSKLRYITRGLRDPYQD